MAGGSEFQVKGVAVLNDRLANDVRRNGTHSSGTDDDRVLRALVRNQMCWFRANVLHAFSSNLAAHHCLLPA